MIFLRLLFLVALVASMPVQIDADSSVGLTKRGILSSIMSFFDPDSSNSAAATTPAAAAAATPVAPATPATPAANTATVNYATINYATVNYATTAVAAAPAAAAPASSSSSGGWLSRILALFDGSSSAATTPAAASTPAAATTAAVAATTVATPAVAKSSAQTPATSATTSTSGGFLNNVFGSGSTSSAQSPGFTGLVSVVGAGNLQTPSVSGSSVASGGSNSGASNSQIASIARYAEMGAGITYSPYTKSGSCKTASEVQSDISMLSGYSLVRLYSVDCSGIQNVVAAMSSSQKLFLGVWDITTLSTDLPSMAQQVLTGSRGWSAVHTVSIGNEVVNAGTNSVAQVASAVSSARGWFKQNASSYSGYIVAVDTLAATMQNQQMCDISDYIAVNCHPYFSGIEASTSGTWLQEQISNLQSFCGGSKKILITESGWPTYGNTVGQAVPSVANQLLAVEGLGKVVGDQVIMFTTYNDYWKAPGSYNVEQHWGIYGDPEY